MMERLRESRWVYILLSVLLAVVFWLYIRDTEDPTMSRPIYNVPVQIANERVLEERGLTVSGLSQSSLTVEVTGPVSVLNNLTRSNVTASVDVSSITEAGEYELNCRLILPNNVDTTGAFFPEQSNPVSVTVDTLVTETMNVEVRLEGSVANGYQAGTPVADPETVELRGSAEQVARVKRVVAILEADDLDQSFAGKLPLKLLDEDGETITDSNVKLSEDSAYVTMTVGVVKRVKLTVNLLSGGGATAEQANEVCKLIRETIAGLYDAAVADSTVIQYGGSMNPKNCKGLMAQPEIDGGLIGGASLKAEDFSKVVHFDA